MLLFELLANLSLVGPGVRVSVRERERVRVRIVDRVGVEVTNRALPSSHVT